MNAAFYVSRLDCHKSYRNATKTKQWATMRHWKLWLPKVVVADIAYNKLS